MSAVWSEMSVMAAKIWQRIKNEMHAENSETEMPKKPSPREKIMNRAYHSADA